MSDRNKLLPLGISDFKKIRKEQYYFVDKSLLIRGFIKLWCRSYFISQAAQVWQNVEHEHVEGVF